MGTGGIARKSRLLVIAVAIAALLIAVHTVISRLSEPAVYDADSTEIAVGPGEHFEIQVADGRADGFRWIIAAPRPDPAVLRASGSHVDPDEPPSSGAGGSRYLDFVAVGAGRTDLRLLRCRRCTDGAGVAEGTQSLEFRVTVG
ncbi:protease inhibitor I42 family protein [Streptomyces chattanoogensis]|uniref:protease inhibitor I42 family protein n=1 Tax=Streptomyces chattanoogensis TaxID=66876 RepID=UPI000A544794|nr:protease inhibitor I42 family protein [Streptomyces chattanoogensis]